MRHSMWTTGLRTALLALGLLALSATAGQASALVKYNTSGSIDSTGVSGAGIISFIPVTNGKFSAPSQFSLGSFQVGGLSDSSTTTYTNTPFHITFNIDKIDGSTPTPNQTPIQISGMLNGSVSGSDQTTVRATFNPISDPNFLAGNYSNTISILDNPLSLVPSSTNNGRSSAQASLVSVQVTTPEPATVALFLTTLAGLGLRRLRQNRSA